MSFMFGTDCSRFVPDFCHENFFNKESLIYLLMNGLVAYLAGKCVTVGIMLFIVYHIVTVPTQLQLNSTETKLE